MTRTASGSRTNPGMPARRTSSRCSATSRGRCPTRSPFWRTAWEVPDDEQQQPPHGPGDDRPGPEPRPPQAGHREPDRGPVRDAVEGRTAPVPTFGLDRLSPGRPGPRPRGEGPPEGRALREEKTLTHTEERPM